MIKIPTKEIELIKQCPVMPIRQGIKSIDELFESGILGQFSPGQYVILPKGAQILKGIRFLLDKYVKDKLAFEEVVLPKIAPLETFRKADILGRWDYYLQSVRPFSRTNGVEEEYIMDPLQCTTFYQFWEGKTVDVSQGPIRWHDDSGPTYRNEDSNKIKPGVKQREFHRSEFIYLGTKKQVIETREACLSQIEELCVDLGLRYRIVVGSSCYQLKDGELAFPESVDEIPIKDLEIYIPHEDPHEERWLEVVGSSALASAMTSRFNIKGKNGEELWSGCTGIGLDRLMYALVSTWGTDIGDLTELQGNITYEFETPVYPGNILYGNVVGRYNCTNDCGFCSRPRDGKPGTSNIYEKKAGTNLFLSRSPSFEEIMQAIESDLKEKHEEFAIIGLGEPLMWLPKVARVIKTVKERYDVKTRIDTNGVAAVIYENAAQQLAEAGLDEIRISLNAITEEEYDALCRPGYETTEEECEALRRPGYETAFKNLVEFTQECIAAGIDTKVSFVVKYAGTNNRSNREYRKFAQSLGVKPENVILREYVPPLSI